MVTRCTTRCHSIYHSSVLKSVLIGKGNVYIHKSSYAHGLSLSDWKWKFVLFCTDILHYAHFILPSEFSISIHNDKNRLNFGNLHSYENE